MKTSIEILILSLIIISVLLHEYFKEGYFFKLSDIFKFPTHESIIVIILVSYILYKTVWGTVHRRVKTKKT